MERKMTSTKRSQAVSSASRPYILTVPTQEYRSLPIPTLPSAKIGDCFVPVTALPDELEQFMKVNPRVPSRTLKGALAGPVIKGIRETLLDDPEDMAIKNQGIYLLVEDAQFEKLPGGAGRLRLMFTDPARHGIVNGGHTYLCIRDTIEDADDDTLGELERAYVRLHILQGIDPERVA